MGLLARPPAQKNGLGRAWAGSRRNNAPAPLWGPLRMALGPHEDQREGGPQHQAGSTAAAAGVRRRQVVGKRAQNRARAYQFNSERTTRCKISITVSTSAAIVRALISSP